MGAKDWGEQEREWGREKVREKKKLERLLERGRVGAETKLTHIETVEGNWGEKASHS